jgi:hypothetical protein
MGQLQATSSSDLIDLYHITYILSFKLSTVMNN